MELSQSNSQNVVLEGQERLKASHMSCLATRLPPDREAVPTPSHRWLACKASQDASEELRNAGVDVLEAVAERMRGLGHGNMRRLSRWMLTS